MGELTGANQETLLNDLNFTGFLFESMVIHDLRVYGQDNDAKVYHYRDSSGLEVDGIVKNTMVIGVLLRLNWVPDKLMKLLLICCGLLVWSTLTNALRLNH